MDPEKILADTGQSIAIWQNGKIEITDNGQTVGVIFDKRSLLHIAEQLIAVGEGRALYVNPERIVLLRDMARKEFLRDIGAA